MEAARDITTLNRSGRVSGAKALGAPCLEPLPLLVVPFAAQLLRFRGGGLPFELVLTEAPRGELHHKTRRFCAFGRKAGPGSLDKNASYILPRAFNSPTDTSYPVVSAHNQAL